MSQVSKRSCLPGGLGCFAGVRVTEKAISRSSKVTLFFDTTRLAMGLGFSIDRRVLGAARAVVFGGGVGSLVYVFCEPLSARGL